DERGFGCFGFAFGVGGVERVGGVASRGGVGGVGSSLRTAHPPTLQGPPRGSDPTSHRAALQGPPRGREPTSGRVVVRGRARGREPARRGGGRRSSGGSRFTGTSRPRGRFGVMSATTLRLTVGQAVVRFLAAQYSERDGQRHKLFAGCFGIFGHGNVAGL